MDLKNMGPNNLPKYTKRIIAIALAFVGIGFLAPDKSAPVASPAKIDQPATGITEGAAEAPQDTIVAATETGPAENAPTKVDATESDASQNDLVTNLDQELDEDEKIEESDQQTVLVSEADTEAAKVEDGEAEPSKPETAVATATDGSSPTESSSTAPHPLKALTR